MSELRNELQSVRVLIAGYFGIGLLALLAPVVLRDHPDLVNSTVWVRNTAVLVSGALCTSSPLAPLRASDSRSSD